MRQLPASPVFTTAEAYETGWTDSALLCAVRAGRLNRLRRGVYAPSGSTDPLLAARAIATTHPDLVLSHLTGARMHGIPIVGHRSDLPGVTVPPSTNADIAGAHVHRARLRDHEKMLVDGVLVTAPARTALDVARHFGLDTSVPAIDFVLHNEVASAEELLDAFEFCRTWPGGRRARRALMLSDSRSESPLESISRLAITRLRLPPAEPQVNILDPDGRFVGRGDFYWDEFGVVGEADGYAKYADSQAKVAEDDREGAFDDLNLEVARWGWHRVRREAPLLRRGLCHAFDRGSRRDRVGLPRLWTPASTLRVHVL